MRTNANELIKAPPLTGAQYQRQMIAHFAVDRTCYT